MKAVLTASAQADLEDIADYIATDSPPRALSYVRELRAAAEALGEFPEAYPLVPRYESYGVRRRPCGNDLIFYEIVRDIVFIVHILHGAQDYEAILFPDD